MWIKHIIFKLLYFCFQHANELLSAAQTRGGLTVFSFKNELGRVGRELQAAKKDNDFIYHDKIPDVKTLPSLGKLAVAKITPFPEKNMSDKFTGKFYVWKNTSIVARNI